MIEVQTGYCVCCGSPQIVKCAGNQRAADMMATFLCECEGAQHSRDMAQMYAKVDSISEMPGFDPLQADVLELVVNAAKLVLETKLASAQISLIDGSRITIRMGTHGLVMRRERKDVRAAQADVSDNEMMQYLDEMIPYRKKDEEAATGT